MNFPTQILNCDSYSLTLLDLFPFSDTSIFSTMPFPPLGNSDHVEASGAIDFPSNSKGNAPFHRIIYHYSQADLESLIDHFHGRISLNSVLVLLLVNFVSGFRSELLYISLIIKIRSSLTHLHSFQLLVLLS